MKGDPQPKAFAARAGEKGSSGETLRVNGIVEIKVSDIADVFDFIEGNENKMAAEIEQIDSTVADETGGRQITCQSVCGRTAHEDFLA